MWEKGNGKRARLCVNTRVDCIYCPYGQRKLPIPITALFSFLGVGWGVVSGKGDSNGYFQNTHIHTRSQGSRQQRYGAEMHIWATSVSCDQKWLLTHYSITSTNNNKRHNYEKPHNGHNKSQHNNTRFLSQDIVANRTIDQVKAHYGTRHPVSRSRLGKFDEFKKTITRISLHTFVFSTKCSHYDHQKRINTLSFFVV